MKQLTLTLSDRTHARMVALLKAQHDRNPFRDEDDLFEHNLESLVESLLTRFLDEQIPPPPADADLNTLYFERWQYLTRLRVLTEVIRQFDAISVPNFEAHQMILLVTKEQVLRQVQVQKAVEQYNQAIAQHPNAQAAKTWPASVEAFMQDLERIEDLQSVGAELLLQDLQVIGGE